MNCDAHIWCCPTPATYSASGPAIAPIREMTRCGDTSPSGGSPYPSGYVPRIWSSQAHQPSRSGRRPSAASPCSTATSSAITSRQSPTIGTSATRFLEISAGSMSAWTTSAFGANVESLPVTRSSKRAPRLTIRSAFCRAVTAATVPCMPGMPRLFGWLSGSAPRAISVVTTGAPVSSVRARSSALARALTTPPPT